MVAEIHFGKNFRFALKMLEYHMEYSMGSLPRLRRPSLHPRGNKRTSVIPKYKSAKKFEKYRSPLVPLVLMAMRMFTWIGEMKMMTCTFMLLNIEENSNTLSY